MADSRVKQRIEEGFVYVRLDIESDEGETFAERYGIPLRYPRFYLLDVERDRLRALRLPGFSPEGMLSLLADV